jgi:hypothetical protein
MKFQFSDMHLLPCGQSGRNELPLIKLFMVSLLDLFIIMYSEKNIELGKRKSQSSPIL